MSEPLVVVSRIKKMVKAQGYRTGLDCIEALSKKVEEMVNTAIVKIKTDGKRKTIGAEDI